MVDADVDARIHLANVVGLSDDVDGLLDEVIERILGLLAQLLAVTQEQHALDPAGVDQQLGQGNGHARLARAGGLHHQRATVALREALGHAGDALDLVQTAGDGGVRAHIGQQVQLLAALEADAVLQRVLGKEAEDRAWRITTGVVPHPDVVAIGVEDHRPLAMHLLQGVRVQLGLLLPDTGIDLGLLGLDDGERLAVVVPEHIVAVALAAGGGLMRNLDLLANGIARRRASGHVPPGHAQIAVDQPLAGVVLAELQLVGSGGGCLAGLQQFQFGWRRHPLSCRGGCTIRSAQRSQFLQRLPKTFFLEAVLLSQGLGLALELSLAVDAFYGRLLELGKVMDLPTHEAHMQPTGKLPGLLDAADRVSSLDVLTMRTAIAKAPQQVQLV